jgi:energy-coupling factor transport system permease protein
VRLHTWAWLFWLASGLVMVSATRNPLYLILLDIALIILQTLTTPAHKQLPSFTLRFAASILLLSSLFNLFISRFGETIILTIPNQIPLIGGPLTLEALVFGATNGLVLIGMFTLFTILNQVLPVRSLVRLIPQAFEPIAVVTTIAITFIPATQKQLHAIREAQAVRGQKIQRLRDWLPLIIPLVTGGLERSMQIAEAMTARGFSGQAEQRPSIVQRLLMPFGLFMMIGGWLWQLSQPKLFIGWGILLVGVIAILIQLFLGGRKNRITRYYEETWNLPSTLVFITSLASILLLSFALPGSETLLFDPYPRVILPGFSPWQALFFLLILFPILLPEVSSHDSH